MVGARCDMVCLQPRSSMPAATSRGVAEIDAVLGRNKTPNHISTGQILP